MTIPLYFMHYVKRGKTPFYGFTIDYTNMYCNDDMLPARTQSVRSAKPGIKVSFFSDEVLEKIYEYIDNRITQDIHRKNYHMRYRLLVTLLLRTGACLFHRYGL